MAVYNPQPNPVAQRRNFFNSTIRRLSDREAIYLFKKLRRERKLSSDKVKTVNPQEHLVKLLEDGDYDRNSNTLLEKAKIELVPEDNFLWLKDNQRAQVFTLNWFISNVDLDIDMNQYDKKPMSQIYSIIDFLLKNISDRESRRERRRESERFTLEEKVEFLSRVKEDWNAILEANKSITKWLKEEDDNQIHWTYNYLIERDFIEINIELHKDIRELRSCLLGSIDSMILCKHLNSESQCFSDEGKQLFIDKMRRAWSQQKYRDAGKTKKRYHLPLATKTQKRLEKMAEIKGVSRTTMLDIIINSRYDLDFLDIDGNELYKD